jgi:hypothetical protein
MAAIPFSLIGILPAHAAMDAMFTATSMIGFMAGAGIVVRNSIILLDFIEQRIAEGIPLDEAVIDAGAVRFRPMLLTALAVVVGGGRYPVRSDLPRSGHFPHGRRDRLALDQSHGRARALLRCPYQRQIPLCDVLTRAQPVRNAAPEEKNGPLEVNQDYLIAVSPNRNIVSRHY